MAEKNEIGRGTMAYSNNSMEQAIDDLNAEIKLIQNQNKIMREGTRDSIDQLNHYQQLYRRTLDEKINKVIFTLIITSVVFLSLIVFLIIKTNTG